MAGKRKRTAIAGSKKADATSKEAAEPRRSSNFADEIRVVSDERFSTAYSEVVKALAATSRYSESFDAEPQPLSPKEIARIADPKRLAALIEEEWPEENRRMLSPLATKDWERGAQKLSPPFARLETNQSIDRDQLVEDILELLSLASHVVHSSLEWKPLLKHEAELIRGVGELLEAYRVKRKEIWDEAAMFRIWNEVVQIYREVRSAWPKRTSKYDASGLDKLGKSMSAPQRAAIAKARAALTRLTEREIKRFVPTQATSKVVEALLVDGDYIRSNGGPVDTAKEILEGVLPMSGSWIKNLRDMSPLEAQCANRPAPFVLSQTFWSDHKSVERALADVEFTAKSAMSLVRRLVIASAVRRRGASVPSRPTTAASRAETPGSSSDE